MIGGADPAGFSVAFAGNVANVGLRTVRALRTRGIDAHLFVNEAEHPLSRVENEDPSFSDDLPAWIHESRWITPSSLLFPFRSRLAKDLRSYDLVIATGPSPIWAQFAKRPWCFFATGGDLTVRPFPLTFWRWFPSWPHRAAEVVAGAWQRRAIRRATELWLQPFAPMQAAADRLSVPAERRSSLYFPLAIDTDIFDPGRPTSDDFWAEGLVSRSDFVVFHPSRIVMDRSPRLVRTGQWKGNDVLIRGFATFVKAGTVRRPLLVLPAIEDSRDIAEARALVQSLGIEDQVLWVHPPRGETLQCEQMVALYRVADVVADEFGVGWFGNVTLEGLAMATPVISYVDDEIMRMLYRDGHPILSARDAESVSRVLVGLAQSSEDRREIGAKSRTWMVEHHSPPAVVKTYVTALSDVLTESR